MTRGFQGCERESAEKMAKEVEQSLTDTDATLASLVSVSVAPRAPEERCWNFPGGLDPVST